MVNLNLSRLENLEAWVRSVASTTHARERHTAEIDVCKVPICASARDVLAREAHPMTTDAIRDSKHDYWAGIADASAGSVDAALASMFRAHNEGKECAECAERVREAVYAALATERTKVAGHEAEIERLQRYSVGLVEEAEAARTEVAELRKALVKADVVCVKCGWTYLNHRFKDNRRRCPPFYISAFKANPNGYTRPDTEELRA